MARGWESKAVESQMEEAKRGGENLAGNSLSQDEADRKRKREGLLLSRIRVMRDLESAANPRYREILREALNHLERELAGLADSEP